MYLTFQDVLNYQRDGYVMVRNLFSKEEVNRLIEEVESGARVSQTTRGSLDQSGKAAKLAIWHELGDDIWASASTNQRIVNNVRILMGQEISFFHGKVMLKEAKSGGAWEWHQDYGYWYNQGFFYPHMISAFVALDEATVENGCLNVLKGSHELGRLEHGNVGGQTGADPLRIKQIEEKLEMVQCEMSPGSVLFFHSNLLHSSAANDSDHHRRSFIMCYNAWNNPQLVKGEYIHRDPCPTDPKASLV